jgi:pyridoxal phosphate enzyme (YggS family)
MIKENVRKILEDLPKHIELVAATKERGVSEIKEAIEAGIKIIGENYVKEAEEKFKAIGNGVRWHLIGHLQKNKVKRAVKIFDMIETLDSVELAEILDKECRKINKIMPVLIEINSAKEPQKSGVFPENAESFVSDVMAFDNLKLMGLMTIGPLVGEPQIIRSFFKKTKEIFDNIEGLYGGKLEWKYLSMGMSDTYKIALEEGANIIRIGTTIFGPRKDTSGYY